ncbi:unnamed protein product [Parajaminaea phylloscopi]
MRPSLPRLLRVRPVPATSATSARLPPSLRPRSGELAAAGESSSTSSSSSAAASVKPTLAEALIAQSESETWPKNLRVHKFVKNKEKFWNVPKEQRNELRKLLREE